MISFRVVGGGSLAVDGRSVRFGDTFESHEVEHEYLVTVLSTGQVTVVYTDDPADARTLPADLLTLIPPLPARQVDDPDLPDADRED